MKKDNGLLTGILMLIIGMFFLIIMSPDLGYIFTGKAKDVNKMIESGDEPKVRDTVSMEVDLIIDWYAELTSTRKGSRTTTYHCYARLDNGKIISITAKKDSKEFDKIDRLIRQTNAYYSGKSDIPPTPIKLEGTIRKIDSNVKGYYTTYASLMGYSSTDMYMITLDTSQYRIYHILCFGVIVFVTFLGGLFVFVELKDKKDKKDIAKAKIINTYVVDSNSDIDDYMNNN
ncbi:MAG: hypothetical protein E7258_05825 [Lachnospiraceae bacterium]|nr:hypothetical protein [Lachnospiraceae bacterium]